jgi:anti-sigma regulatory factor (Ser/Thr protein kinase)
MQPKGNPLTVTYPANPEVIAVARHALTAFAAQAGADQRQVEAVRLAVSEAVTNAVLHAYRDTPGDVHVTAALVSEELWVLVGDDGHGMEARPDRPGLGLGLALISQVSDEMSVVPRAGGGTEVRMRFALVNAENRQSSPSASIGGIATEMRGGNAGRPAESRGCHLGRRARRPA